MEKLDVDRKSKVIEWRAIYQRTGIDHQPPPFNNTRLVELAEAEAKIAECKSWLKDALDNFHASEARIRAAEERARKAGANACRIAKDGTCDTVAQLTQGWSQVTAKGEKCITDLRAKLAAADEQKEKDGNQIMGLIERARRAEAKIADREAAIKAFEKENAKLRAENARMSEAVLHAHAVMDKITTKVRKAASTPTPETSNNSTTCDICHKPGADVLVGSTWGHFNCFQSPPTSTSPPTNPIKECTKHGIKYADIIIKGFCPLCVNEAANRMAKEKESDEDKIREAKEARDERQERRHDANRQHAEGG